MSHAAWAMAGAWQFAPAATVPLAVLAAAYLAGVHRAAKRRPGKRRPGKGWPRARTAAFLGGLAVAALATQGPVAVYDDVSLPAHMVQHLLLIMVAPPLFVYGRPVTLAMHVTRNPWHTRIKRLLRSRVVTAATWPGTALALYWVVVAGTHLTGLLTARGALHDAEHEAYLLAGYLYFLPVVGSEPIRWRASALGRYLLLLAAMPADVATGAVLLLRGRTGGYSASDVHAGGLVMVAGSELLMAGLALVFAVAVVRDAAADLDAAADTKVSTLAAGRTGQECASETGSQPGKERICSTMSSSARYRTAPASPAAETRRRGASLPRHLGDARRAGARRTGGQPRLPASARDWRALEAHRGVRRRRHRGTVRSAGVQAAFLARAVIQVVDEATQGGLMAKVSGVLPDDIRQLVTAGSTGNLSDDR